MSKNDDECSPSRLCYASKQWFQEQKGLGTRDALWVMHMQRLIDGQTELLKMLSEFAGYGEELWDREDFRSGYKKIPSGKLVDCRVLLRDFGITQFDA